MTELKQICMNLRKQIVVISFDYQPSLVWIYLWQKAQLHGIEMTRRYLGYQPSQG